MPQDYTVRAADRALAILDCFDIKHTSFSLKELAEEIELTPSTTLRLVSTLEHRGYIYRNSENNRYFLGYRVAQLGNSIYTNMDICREAQTFMKELIEKYNESVGIYERNGDKRVCITRINSNKSLRTVLVVGNVYSLTRGAAGKVLLAHMREEEISRILANDPSITIEKLKSIKDEGYAISHGERDVAVESIAAPVFSRDGSVEHALFMTGPVGRFSEYPREEIILDIKKASLSLSMQLGYCPTEQL